MTIMLDKIIAYGLLLTVVFTALAFGTVEAWSVAIFELSILVLLVLWAVKCLLERKIEIRLPPTALPLAAFLIYTLVQAHATIDGKSLSFDQEATRRAALILFFLLAAHLIAANFYATRERLKTVAVFLSVFGGLFAFFALLQYLTWNDRIFWLREIRAGGGMVTGSFVNHNHFAAYLELIISIPLALAWRNVLKNVRVLFAFAAVIMTVAAISALSRGGMISLAASGLFVLLANLYQSSRNQSLSYSIDADYGFGAAPESNRLSRIFNAAGGLVIAAAILVGVFLIGSEPVIDRLTNNNVIAANGAGQSFDNARGWMWRNSLAVFRENPLFGVGLGAYETAFPRYAESDGITKYGAQFNFDRAHNDYLQILTDTGIIGALLAVWFIVTLLGGISRALKLRDSLSQALAAGCGAGIIALVVHSFFDFSLQLPAIALLFLVVSAITAILPDVEAESRKHRIRILDQGIKQLTGKTGEAKRLPPAPTAAGEKFALVRRNVYRKVY